MPLGGMNALHFMRLARSRADEHGHGAFALHEPLQRQDFDIAFATERKSAAARSRSRAGRATPPSDGHARITRSSCAGATCRSSICVRLLRSPSPSVGSASSRSRHAKSESSYANFARATDLSGRRHCLVSMTWRQDGFRLSRGPAASPQAKPDPADASEPARLPAPLSAFGAGNTRNPAGSAGAASGRVVAHGGGWWWRRRQAVGRG